MGKAKTNLASEIGARLDIDVMNGGGSDDTDVLQAALNEAPNCVSLKLVIDGAARVRGLDVHSNTTIECVGANCGFYLADNADRPILRNANPSDSERIDRNIQIVGGTYNGNNLHQVHHTAENNWVVPIGFFGVENLLVAGITIRNMRTFALHLAQWKWVTLENIRIELASVGSFENQDGIHVNGPGRFLTARNIAGRSWDDFFALNADDGVGILEETRELGPFVKDGDITDVLIDGLILEDALQGVRILSTISRVDRITIRNMSGDNRNYGVMIDTFAQSGGNFGSLTFENIDVYQHDTEELRDPPFLFALGGRIENLTLRNIRRNNSWDARPTIKLRRNADIRQLAIDGLHIYENTQSSEGAKYIQVLGSVAQLSIRNAGIFREAELPTSGTLIAIETGDESILDASQPTDNSAETAANRGIETLILEGVCARNLAHLVSQKSGKLENVQAANIRHSHSGSAAFAIENAVVGGDSRPNIQGVTAVKTGEKPTKETRRDQS